MKQLLLLLLTIFSFFILSCKNSTTSGPEDAVKVSGLIVFDGQPVDSAIVQIDQVINWKTTTNSEGLFQISDVTRGTHNFQAFKKLTNGETVSQTTELVVGNEDIELGEIRLPIPPILYPLDSTSINSNGIHLYWSNTLDPEFREYKLYRKTDPGLDENTGNLLFVTTTTSDTQFVDSNFSYGLTYYYRVFILSAFGKLGGSNLVSILTPVQNYIVNGDFEEASNQVFPDYWTYNPGNNEYVNLGISTIEKYSGSKSLHVSLLDSTIDIFGSHSAWMNQDIETTGLPKNIQYKFSFWAKSEIGKPFVYIIFSGDNENKYFQVPSGGDWQEYSTTFILADNVTNIRVHIAAFGEFRENFRIEGWVDLMDLSIVQ